jgi:class 3 adenylate cyclase/ABC-type glycerol-3-phosphate transport system substrate-binding protein
MATEASTPRRKLSAILMVDVSGFSRMMGRDEEGTTALIRDFHTRTQFLVEAHEGWVVDTAGDSVFGEFASVVNAVRCAQAIQQAQATVNATRLPGEHIETRIGVHLGDVIVQDAHVYGDGVNIAARLQAVAAPGSICVSEAVYQQVYKKCDLAFEDLGVQALKNIEPPIRLYRVVEPGAAAPRGRRAPWKPWPGSAWALVLLLLVGAGVTALWSGSRPPAPLRILTSLAREEWQVFEALVTTFGKQYGLTVAVENVDWPQALSMLKQDKGTIDLITFDINWPRFELVHNHLLEDLSGVKGLLPSLMPPVMMGMMQALDVNEQRFFLPFRPNVRLVFVHRKQLAALPAARPETWADVLDVAKRWYERYGEPRVVVEGGEADKPLLLLELIRSARGDPCNVLHPQSQEAVQFLQKLWHYVSPPHSRVDWQTASGLLLSKSAYVARNWAFALSLLHEAGQEREQEFEVYPGWRWAPHLKPSYLLGGEVLALPKHAPHKEVTRKLLRFLTSEEAQTDLAKKLSWPPMRLDVMGALEEWQQRYQDTITLALHYAEPVPPYWWPAMQPLYTQMFAKIVSLQADLERTLVDFQALLKGICEKTP